MTKTFTQFDDFALEKMALTKLPALCFALIQEGDVVHQKTMGFRDLKTRESPTPKTLMGLGSVTKVFTSLAIMQLHERGQLDIGDRVSQHVALPFSEDLDIRIWHLLTHSSGLPGLGFSESKLSARWFMHGFPVNSLEDLLTFMQGAEDWIQTSPGARWFYLNEGYILLGAIIEKVTGQRYADYVTENILKPAGMDRTYYDREKVEAERDVATQYMLDRDNNYLLGANLYGNIPAAGGLVSNLEDMVTFTKMFIGQGSAPNDTSIITPETLGSMREPQVKLPQAQAPEFGEGDEAYHQSYGFHVTENFFGQTVVGHGGGVMGGTTYMAFIPEKNAGVVLLSNGHGYPMAQLAMYGLSLLLGEDPEELPFMRSEGMLGELVGSYESFRGTMAASVHKNGDFLELRMHFKHETRVTPLVPFNLGERKRLFLTFSGARRRMVEFRITGDTVELISDRYKFRRRQ